MSYLSNIVICLYQVSSPMQCHFYTKQKGTVKLLMFGVIYHANTWHVANQFAESKCLATPLTKIRKSNPKF